MTRIAPPHSAHQVPETIYQKYAPELRKYVDVSFEISKEGERLKYIPTWNILESDNPEWEACRKDETNSADKIRLALWRKIIDDTITQKRGEFQNQTANQFLKSMNKYYSDMDSYADEIIGVLVNEKLTPQLLST